MEKLYQHYQDFFGRDSRPQYHIFAPYRICPIGAHIDHQHGPISGFAFDHGIDFLFGVTDGVVQAHSLNFEGEAVVDVTRQVELDERQKNWGDYLRGTVWALQRDYTLRHGIDCVISGSLPVGGLSSSAALLCGLTTALARANDIVFGKEQVMHYASLAERKYIGLDNGMLDHACVVLSEKDKLLWLDTRSMEYRLIPFGGGGPLPFKAGVFFSGVTRKLTDTDYNLRVSECRTAAWIMQAYEDVPLHEFGEARLRDVPYDTFLKYRDVMPARFARRAQHFYEECQRVDRGAKAWEEGDAKAFGQLMFESGESSIHNYQSGGKELIALHRILRQTPGIIGARFSGAGFKGACVALVDPACEESVRQQVTEAYLAEFPEYKGAFQIFFCQSADGVKLDTL